MKNNLLPGFSKKTLEFIMKASRQKRPDWLEKNRTEYDARLLLPLQNLARHLKTELGTAALGYHFPQKGIGRLKCSANKVAERGSLYKNWISYSASVPSGSRFEHNPSLFFMINPEDLEGDSVLAAGGLYMPSSRQLRAVREAIAQDSTPFDRIFAWKTFANSFPDGFSDERISSRVPRGFNPEHPRVNWLKLQGFFVWRAYSFRDFSSSRFPEYVARDWKQALKLNVLLDQAVKGNWKKEIPQSKISRLSSRLENLEKVLRKPDF
ncbi:MAG: DUF2461 family protein [Bdellovibrionia bacterium]